ncbi:MAG: hypothetical protein HYY06_03500 [Deltaproteobacteria bacterium]|nr:hypothetical protein [Deltaproteobacteria bacterium]
MRLRAAIDVFLSGEIVPRRPSFWDRARAAFGADVDLSSEKMRVALEATNVVDRVRAALGRMGIDDALSLVIDDHVIFNDDEGRPDDLGDLFIAMSEHAPVFGGGFRALRMAVEHREAGLHSVVETIAKTEHGRDDPTVMVRVGARLVDLEARAEESAEGYRTRIAPLLADPTLLEGHRRQFEAFVAKLGDALRAAFPEGRVEELEPQASVVRPDRQGRTEPRRPPAPTEPAYDPYRAYHSSPFDGMLSGLLIGSFLSSAFAPHDIVVVDPHGAQLGHADAIGDLHDADGAYDGGDPDDGDVDDGDLDGGDFGGDFGD